MAIEKQDELDRILDAALAKYAAVEPRRGLEDRVLGNLRAEQLQHSDRAWWRWGAIAALSAIVVVAIALTLKSGAPLHREVVRHAPTDIQMPKPGPRIVSNGNGNEVRRPQVKRAMRRTTARRSEPENVTARNPKMDQFPSPRPLSEQEKILANYIAQYPEHAALIAQARTDALRRDREEEMRDAAAGGEQDSQR